MTAQEVAQEAHLHINTVIRYLKDGTIRGRKIGKRGLWRITRSDFNEFLNNSVPCFQDIKE